MVARAELLSRPKTPREAAPQSDGKKRAKGAAAAATPDARPAQARGERGGKRKPTRCRTAHPPPTTEPEAAQDNEAVTEDTE